MDNNNIRSVGHLSTCRHLTHAVVVVQQADVLRLDHLDEAGQSPSQLAAPVDEAVHAVLNVKPVLKISNPAAAWNDE